MRNTSFESLFPFTGVDLAFEQLLDNIFGSDFMNHFKNRLPASYIDLVTRKCIFFGVQIRQSIFNRIAVDDIV